MLLRSTWFYDSHRFQFLNQLTYSYKTKSCLGMTYVEVEVQLHVLLTSALYGSVQSALLSDRFIPGD